MLVCSRLRAMVKLRCRSKCRRICFSCFSGCCPLDICSTAAHQAETIAAAGSIHGGLIACRPSTDAARSHTDFFYGKFECRLRVCLQLLLSLFNKILASLGLCSSPSSVSLVPLRCAYASSAANEQKQLRGPLGQSAKGSRSHRQTD